MNVYMLRERENSNYYCKNRRWGPKMNSAKIFTELSEARKTRASQKNMMGVKNPKIEIVEFQLSEKATL